MTKVIDLNEIDHDPLMCAFCIDWSDIKISTANKDSEYGRLLAEKAFKNVAWNQHSDSLMRLMSKIINQLPTDAKLHYVVQGFIDEVSSRVIQEIKNRRALINSMKHSI